MSKTLLPLNSSNFFPYLQFPSSVRFVCFRSPADGPSYIFFIRRRLEKDCQYVDIATLTEIKKLKRNETTAVFPAE